MANQNREIRRPGRRNSKKWILLLSCVMLFLGTAIGGTVAYLAARSGQVTNSFVAGHVGCVVEPGSKSNGVYSYTVKPDGTTNTPVYLRAAVTANWLVDGGIHWQAPTVEDVADDWTLKTDGFFYYDKEVKVGDEVTVLKFQVTPSTEYELQLEVIGEAIQSGPAGSLPWTK